MIVTEIEKCKELWNSFSKNKDFWEVWDIVSALYDKSMHELCFIHLKEGLIPLWKENKIYYRFGGGYPENVTLWIDLDSFDKVFDEIPCGTKIFDVNKEQAEYIIRKFPEYEKNFSDKDKRYFLKLKPLGHSFEEHLKKMSKKHRKNLLYDIKRLEHLECKWGGNEYFDFMAKFNRDRFGTESDFFDEDFTRQVKNMFSVLEKKNMLFFLGVHKDGEVVGVEAAAVYKNKYYVLNGGYNLLMDNIGKLLIYKHIQKAMELGAEEIDFLVGDTGWKELWNLDSEICYTFMKFPENNKWEY